MATTFDRSLVAPGEMKLVRESELTSVRLHIILHRVSLFATTTTTTTTRIGGMGIVRAVV